MKLKYKIEKHMSARGERYFIFGYDRHGNKYDSMWSSSDVNRATDLLKRMNRGAK